MADTLTPTATPPASTPPVLDPTSLSGSSPVNLPPAIPATAGGALGDYIKAAVTTPYRAAQDAQIKDETATVKSDQGLLSRLYDQLSGQGQAKEDIYKAEGVDTKKASLDEVTNQIEAERMSLSNKIATIQKNSGGMTRDQVNGEIEAATRESSQIQANLAIVQSAASRSYSTASEIADRKLTAEFEPIKAKLDAAKFFYQENKDQLTKDEDRQYQVMLTQEERNYNLQKEAATALKDTKLKMMQSAAEQNAPVSILSAIQAAKTPEDAMKAAGQYAGNIQDRQLKDAQIANEWRLANGKTPGTTEKKPLTQAQLNKYAKAGIPEEPAIGIAKDLLAGHTLEEIRQNLAAYYGRDVGYGYLDAYMQVK